MWRLGRFFTPKSEKLRLILSGLCSKHPTLAEEDLTCVTELIGEGEKEGRKGKKEWEGERRWESEGFLLPSTDCAAHFSFPTELKRSGNWKGDNPAAEAPQMPMKSFRDIRVLHFGPRLCISFTWGLWKKWLYNDNTWKVFSIRLMHHCQRGRWNRIVSLWTGDVSADTGRAVVCSLNAKNIEM